MEKCKEYIIRPACANDCSSILKLIQELADYENMPNGPQLDLITFKEDGFGKQSWYKCFVAEISEENGDSKIVGYSLYYFSYSTWQGKTVYMEDLYVTPQYRRKGIGKNLWKAVVGDDGKFRYLFHLKEGLKTGCSRNDFSVLSWNKSSINFYEKCGAVNLTLEENWHSFRMNLQQMSQFVTEEEPDHCQ